MSKHNMKELLAELVGYARGSVSDKWARDSRVAINLMKEQIDTLEHLDNISQKQEKIITLLIGGLLLALHIHDNKYNAFAEKPNKLYSENTVKEAKDEYTKDLDGMEFSTVDFMQAIGRKAISKNFPKSFNSAIFTKQAAFQGRPELESFFPKLAEHKVKIDVLVNYIFNNINNLENPEFDDSVSPVPQPISSGSESLSISPASSSSSSASSSSSSSSSFSTSSTSSPVPSSSSSSSSSLSTSSTSFSVPSSSSSSSSSLSTSSTSSSVPFSSSSLSSSLFTSSTSSPVPSSSSSSSSSLSTSSTSSSVPFSSSSLSSSLFTSGTSSPVPPSSSTKPEIASSTSNIGMIVLEGFIAALGIAAVAIAAAAIALACGAASGLALAVGVGTGVFLAGVGLFATRDNKNKQTIIDNSLEVSTTTIPV